MTPRTGLLLIFTAMAFFGMMPFMKPACAGGIANQTCDAAVWETMSSRARLETEREIMQNQNLIFKPDSILSYMCFDAMAGHVANNVGPIFTHSTRWGVIIPLPEGQAAMDQSVITAMTSYLDANFHGGGIRNYLGGRAAGLIHPVPVSSAAATAYACEEMAKIWQVAKCMNFPHDPEADGFYPLINIIGMPGTPNVEGYQTIGDTRNYPTLCGDPGLDWEKVYRASRNESSFGVDGGVNGGYKFHEPLNTLFKDIRPLIEPGLCGPAVKTGVTVVSTSVGNYDDGVCTNAGCTFVQTTEGGTCTPKPPKPSKPLPQQTRT